jgi:hypothetical protein
MPHVDSVSNTAGSSYASLRVLDSIDVALKKYGSSVAQVVYFQLENSFGLKKEEIPKNPEVFVSCLDGFFGGGTSTVKMSILKELERSSGMSYVSKLQLTAALKETFHYWLRERQGYSSARDKNPR